MDFNRHTRNLIANFRRLPEDQGKSMNRTSRTLDSLIDTLVERYSIGKSSVEEHIMQNWTYIVGEHQAHRCAPERIAHGKKLIILVSHATLKQELEFEKRRILSRLKELPYCTQITQIQFRLMG